MIWPFAESSWVCSKILSVYGEIDVFRTDWWPGLAESGQYPGCAYYLTLWYAPQDLALRQGMFFSAASAAGAFSGLLAYGIDHMEGTAGLDGWRWM